MSDDETKRSGRPTTSTGASYDEGTGEVHDEASRRGRRPRRELTDAERAERDRAMAERDERRRADLATLRATDPACETADDPAVVWRTPVRMGGEPSGILLDLPRVSGRGLPGSRLVLRATSYDGCGPNGGEAHDYASGFVRFIDGRGNPRRTVGVAIHRSELRSTAAALLAYADELDARDARDAERAP